MHRVGPAYANGTYTGLGAYLTQVKLHVYSGGGLVEFDADTQWGGPPEPRITAQLGPAAGLAACVGVFNVGAIHPGADGEIDFSEPFADPLDPVGRLALDAGFVSRTAILGRYRGATTYLNQTRCPLAGPWASSA